MILEKDFPPDVRVEKEIKSLLQAGHKITLLASSPTAPNQITLWQGATIISYKMPRFIYKSSVAALKFNFYFNYWQKIINLTFADNKFEAIHLHDLPLAQVAANFAKKYQIPFVLDLHENWPAYVATATHTSSWLGNFLATKAKWYVYEKSMVHKADKVIAVIDEMRDRLILAGADPPKIEILPNTPLLAEQTEAPIENNFSEFTLFYGGGLNKHRGLQIVLAALKKLKNQNIKLVVAGSGSYAEVLKNFCHESELDEVVTWLGWQTYEEMMKILSQSDIALIPHLRSEQTDNSSPNKLYQYAWQK
ncbi:MAG: glycosyltransferase, partial [Candidatus Cloacimonadales bacterium]